ncbi:unnamed protein product, partial [Amoebophrya sp. A120]
HPVPVEFFFQPLQLPGRRLRAVIDGRGGRVLHELRQIVWLQKRVHNVDDADGDRQVDTVKKYDGRRQNMIPGVVKLIVNTLKKKSGVIKQTVAQRCSRVV